MNVKWNYQNVCNFVENNSKCKVISKEYPGYSKKMIFLCSCGETFERTFNKFNSQKQRNCPKCSVTRTANSQRKQAADFEKTIKELVGSEYVFTEGYKGAKTKTKIKHKHCGFEYEVTPTGFLSKGRRCPQCKGGMSKTTESLQGELERDLEGNYVLAEDYKGSRVKTKFIHKVCGYEFEASPDNLLRKRSACHRCNGSVGESAVFDFLTKHGIPFKQQYSFTGLKRRYFDFVIVNKSIIAIEFDGIQHFEPVPFFGGEEMFKKQKARDKTKNTYCEKNDINLIRIPYWEIDNIDTILKDAIL